MIWWKEWRSLRGRFLTLSGFFLITAILGRIETFGARFDAMDALPVILVSWGAALLLIPAILGMDAFVGERDQGTEEFLFSKPIGHLKMLAAKVAFRLALSFVLTTLVVAIVLVRFTDMAGTLYWGVRPYLALFLTLSVLVAQIIVLMVTIAVSVRAPYQSTALIIGGTMGTVIAAMPIMFSVRHLDRLQAPWGNFWLLVLLLLLTGFFACWSFVKREPGRSQT
jgi:ABC-type transport system involved in multi-copper enzyme maturation permease subunit